MSGRDVTPPPADATGPDAGAAQTTKARTSRWPAWLPQFIRFGVVGASGVVVNMLIAFLLNQMNGGAANARDPLWTLPGTDLAFRYTHLVYIVSFVVANTTNYQLNRWWTFKGTRRGWWRGFLMFFAAGIVGAIVGFLVKIMLTHPNSPLYLPGWFTDSGWRAREYWGQLVGVLIGTPVNFVINRLVTFRHHAADVRAASAAPGATPAAP